MKTRPEARNLPVTSLLASTTEQMGSIGVQI